MPRDLINIENMRMLVWHEKQKGKMVRYWLPIHQRIKVDVIILYESGGDYQFYVVTPDCISRLTKKILIVIKRSDLNLHSLRHSLVTLAREAGAEILQIQKQVGHSASAVNVGYFHGVIETPDDPKIE